ncbi:MAG: class I SAM-dependent methyltransferase [Chitinophagaceae bacterium]|nr:MAG: class I SAM-dependent methyltransferase [Chitinophagaceae bacterium]
MKKEMNQFSDNINFHKHCLITGSEELMRYSRDDYLSPITVKRYHELLDQFEKYRRTGKILDIGCGIGLFLKEAKKRGWEVYGTEYTDKAMAMCKEIGINMQQGKLDPSLYEPEMFDVVTSFEVMEHINNPQEEVKNIKAVLRKGGLFYFTTPNFNSLERFYLKGKYNIVNYPEHLSYYTKKTANYLLTNNGFKKRKLTTTGLSLSRFKTSIGKKEEYISAESSDEKLRQKLEKNGFTHFVKNVINGLLNISGVGFSLKGWYEKQS